MIKGKFSLIRYLPQVYYQCSLLCHRVVRTQKLVIEGSEFITYCAFFIVPA